MLLVTSLGMALSAVVNPTESFAKEIVLHRPLDIQL